MSISKRIVSAMAFSAWFFVLHANGQSKFATIYNFHDDYPVGLSAVNGGLYGASLNTGTTSFSCGTVFRLEPPADGDGSWAVKTVYSFAQSGDACEPLYAPVAGPDGSLYGVTYMGGTFDAGALFSLQPPVAAGAAWTESVLYSFGGIGYPASNLIPGPQGSFYILTADGGVYGWGGFVQLQPPVSPGGAWAATLLYSFPEGYPASGLIKGNGVFYATTWYSSVDNGLVIQLNPPSGAGGAWTATALHNFTKGEGKSPNSLTLGPGGTLYGTTFGWSYLYGNGEATVFSLTPPASPGGAWTYSLLLNLGGFNLNTPLILRNGNLYGSFYWQNHGGVVFELQPPAAPGGAWIPTYFHKFTGDQQPFGTIVLDGNGVLYGTTGNTNMPQSGTAFRIATQ